MISLSEIAQKLLAEDMTFAQLFSSSTKRRIKRSGDTKVSNAQVVSTKNGKGWEFLLSSTSSTTGETYNGQITFKKIDRTKRAENLPCVVDCNCPDFKYVWAAADARRGASVTGNQSLNGCNGANPVYTNRRMRPGLCKHLLALQGALKKRLDASQKQDLREKLDEVVDQNPNFSIDVEG